MKNDKFMTQMKIIINKKQKITLEKNAKTKFQNQHQRKNNNDAK